MRKRRSTTVATVLLPASLACFLAACDTEEHATLADCERANGPGQCSAQPQAVLMTEKNRPSYASKDTCEQDFGEERCEADKRRTGVYRPFIHPGQTYFYPYGTPGYVGYYGHSPTAQPTLGPSRFVPTTRITTSVSRGGFGSTSVGRGGGA